MFEEEYCGNLVTQLDFIPFQKWLSTEGEQKYE